LGGVTPLDSPLPIVLYIRRLYPHHKTHNRRSYLQRDFHYECYRHAGYDLYFSCSSAQVASTSEELSASAEESAKAVQQISESVQQVASGAQEQSESAASSASSVEQLTQAITQVAKGAETQMNSIQAASKPYPA